MAGTVYEKTVLDYACVAVWINSVLLFIVLMLFTKSAYGRYFDARFGFAVPARFAWFFLTLPAVLIPIACVLYSGPPNNTAAMVTIFFLVAHYFDRTFIYALSIRGGKPTPVILFILGTGFVALNTIIQTRYLLAYTPEISLTSPHFIAGMGLALLGMVINIHSDRTLRNLRKPHEKGYKIPRGGLFEYVSCANFFGEFLEWAGFALATFNFASFTFVGFTFLNLYPRAYQHHQFYHEKFEDYPKHRRIMIPYLL